MNVVTPEGFPHGIRCLKCDETITNGSEYVQELVAVSAEGLPVVELVCLGCAAS